MILEGIVLLIVISLLFIISIPHLLKFALKSYFSTVQMTLYHPLSIRGIILSGPTHLWGLDNLVIFISSVQLGLSPKKWKLRLNITNFQVFCTRKIHSFVPVSLTDSFQEPNILFNFLNFICSNQKKEWISSTLSKEKKVKKQRGALQYFIEGFIHLIFLIIVHTIEVNLIDLKGFVVSGISQQKISFSDNHKLKKSLMLMQCLAEYTICCDVISMQTDLNQHNSYNMKFQCSQIICNSFMHWKNTFLSVNSVKFQIKVPFSLSISKSFEDSDISISIKQGHLNLVPTDFDHFFQFISQMIFDPSKKPRQKREKRQSKQKVEININLIRVEFQQIYQQGKDNEEAKQYLSNLSNSVITLQKLVQNEECFSIQMSTLALTKYYRENTLSHMVEILKVANLQIATIVEGNITEITHEKIILNCYNEEIALFGKIFSLINTRIRFENYNLDIYKDLISNYYPGGTLLSYIQSILLIKKYGAVTTTEKNSKKKGKVMYSPKTIEINLEMKKLRHNIRIQGFTYTQTNRLDELSHEIVIKNILVQYKELTEFNVTDLRLTYSLTNNLNQLTMLIQDITMNQNQQTLIDYFDSFTLFKHLLQFESNQKTKVSKQSKKNITICSISLSFGKQKVTLKSLEIQKQSHVKDIMNNLYFSIDECKISLNKLKPEKKMFKPFVKSTATIFSFRSFSIKQNYEYRNGKAKEKVTIVLKDPCLSLPEVSIESKIKEYVTIFEQMKSHITAYIKNVSNEQLKYIKYHMKQFLEEPPILCIIITKLQLIISDTSINNTILGFSKTVREELSHLTIYNQAQILTVLKRNTRQIYPLLFTEVQKIKLDLNPILDLHPNEKSILKWTENFYLNANDNQNEKLRIKRVEAGNLQLKFKNIQMKIRDYPNPIFLISQILFKGSLMKISRIFEKKNYFVKGDLSFDSINCNIGLNQLSGFNAIFKRFSQFQFLLKSKEDMSKSVKVSQQKSLLHKLLENWRWDLTIQKQKETIMHILTGSNPYDQQKLVLSLGKFKATSFHSKSSLQIENIILKFNDIDVISFQRTEVKLHIFTIDKEIAFDIDSIIPKEASICISSKLVNYIIQLKQLKRDWLLIHGIYEQTMPKKQFQMQNLQRMNYLQIANLLLTKKSNHSGSKSVLSVVNRIKFVSNFSDIKLTLAEKDIELSFVAVDLTTFLIIEPNHTLFDNIEVRKAHLQARKLQAYFLNRNTLEGQINHQRINSMSKGAIFDFFLSQEIHIRYKRYFAVDQKSFGRANFWISVKFISGEFSKRIEKYFRKIVKMFEISKDLKKIQPKTKKVLNPLSKLKSTVYNIILLNRRNRLQKQAIKKYKLVIELQSYKITLENDESFMTLCSNNKATFHLSTKYSDSDPFRTYPESQSILLFPSSKLLIKSAQTQQVYFEIMKTGVFKLQIHTCEQKQSAKQLNWGYCEFQDISVLLSQQHKNFLNDFVQFITNLFNTQQVKRKREKQITEKYYQYKKFKKEVLKEKIEWNQSDLRKKEKKVFLWHFLFKDLSVTLSNQEGPFLFSNIGQTDITMNIFNNSKRDNLISVKNFMVRNELQPQGGQYEHVLIMTEDMKGVTFKVETYDVQAFSEVCWKYLKDLSIQIDPIKIKMTQQLTEHILNYFDQNSTEEQQIPNRLSQYSKKLPEYVQQIKIGSMSFELWYKSSSVFKRMQGITVKLEEYSLKNKLYSPKKIRNDWILWLVKQMGSQVFGVLNQKIFGSNKK